VQWDRRGATVRLRGTLSPIRRVSVGLWIPRGWSARLLVDGLKVWVEAVQVLLRYGVYAVNGAVFAARIRGVRPRLTLATARDSCIDGIAGVVEAWSRVDSSVVVTSIVTRVSVLSLHESIPRGRRHGNRHVLLREAVSCAIVVTSVLRISLRRGPWLIEHCKDRD